MLPWEWPAILALGVEVTHDEAIPSGQGDRLHEVVFAIQRRQPALVGAGQVQVDKGNGGRNHAVAPVEPSRLKF